MNARELARGGIFAAAAVALLYIGGVSPWMGVACCAAAGVTTAVPLMRRGRVKAALLLYLAAALLAALLVPRKMIAAGYAAFFGLYPIVKYGIESRLPRRLQMLCKLVYFNLALAAGVFALRAGLLPNFAEVKGFKLPLGWAAANIVFGAYDVGLSRLIATIRRTLPPD